MDSQTGSIRYSGNTYGQIPLPLPMDGTFQDMRDHGLSTAGSHMISQTEVWMGMREESVSAELHPEGGEAEGAAAELAGRESVGWEDGEGFGTMSPPRLWRGMEQRESTAEMESGELFGRGGVVPNLHQQGSLQGPQTGRSAVRPWAGKARVDSALEGDSDSEDEGADAEEEPWRAEGQARVGAHRSSEVNPLSSTNFFHLQDNPQEEVRFTENWCMNSSSEEEVSSGDEDMIGGGSMEGGGNMSYGVGGGLLVTLTCVERGEAVGAEAVERGEPSAAAFGGRGECSRRGGRGRGRGVGWRRKKCRGLGRGQR